MMSINAILFILTDKEISLYYEGFSNKTIWPLFHYFADKAEYNEKNMGSLSKSKPKIL